MSTARNFVASTVFLAFVVESATVTAMRAQASSRESAFAAHAPRPDVLLVVLDDIGIYDLELYGGPVHAPNLEALAGIGVVFDRCYASPMCMPTRRALLTGRWAISGTGEPCEPPGPLTPPLEEIFLPESLPGGYSSTLFGKWHVGGDPLGKAWELGPLRHGFSAWVAGMGGNVGSCSGTNYGSWDRVDASASGFTSGVVTGYEPLLVRDAFVERWPATRSPKLAVVAHNLAHGPFHAPPAELMPPGAPIPGSNRGRYEAMIRAADTILGQVLETVDLDRTLVIVVGDNGTPGQVAPDPLRAKFTVYERGVRVPLVIAGPGVLPGIRAPDLVHVVDIMPTVLEACAGSHKGVDGSSLWSVLFGKAHPELHPGGVLVGHNWVTDPGGKGTRAVVQPGGAKLRQVDENGDGIVDLEERFDLSSDPFELVPLELAGPVYVSLVDDLAALAGE